MCGPRTKVEVGNCRTAVPRKGAGFPGKGGAERIMN